MNCSALMGSTDIDQDNPVTSENGKLFLLIHTYILRYSTMYLQNK